MLFFGKGGLGNSIFFFIYFILSLTKAPYYLKIIEWKKS